MEDRIIRLEEGQKRLEEGQKKLEGDISFLREETRIGFHTLNDKFDKLNETITGMFDLTAKSIRANKKVAVIMENAYSEATEEYTKIKTRSKR